MEWMRERKSRVRVRHIVRCLSPAGGPPLVQNLTDGIVADPFSAVHAHRCARHIADCEREDLLDLDAASLRGAESSDDAVQPVNKT